MLRDRVEIEHMAEELRAAGTQKMPGAGTAAGIAAAAAALLFLRWRKMRR